MSARRVRRSARARYGIRPPYAVGARVSLSDLLLFEPYGALPASLEEVIPHARPTLQVVVIARRTQWEKEGPHFERDAKLAQKPLPVARQPSKRPVSDPRLFQELNGQTLRLSLRNGLSLELPLLGVGPFDVLLGGPGEEIFVPLHAIVSWAKV